MFESNEEALDALVRAIEAAAGSRPRCGHIPGHCGSQLRTAAGYRLDRDRQVLDTDGLIELLGRWIERYPIVSIEDPLAEDDFEGFRRFTAAFGSKVQVIGDDLW